MSIRQNRNDNRDFIVSKIVSVNETLAGLPVAVNGVATFEETGVIYSLNQTIDTGNIRYVAANGVQVRIISDNPLSIFWDSALEDDNALFGGSFGRLEILNVLFRSSTTTSKFYDLNGPVGSRSIHEKSLVFGFGEIGTVENNVTFYENIAFNNCLGGITLKNNGTSDDFGNDWNIINFSNHTGDHIMLDGDFGSLRFNAIRAAPSTGDSVYNFDNFTSTSSASFNDQLFNGTNGGTLGLEITYNSDTTLGNLYNDIGVDTSNGHVNFTLPDSANNIGRDIEFKKAAGQAPFTLTAVSGDTIEGVDSITIRGTRRPAVRIRANSGWEVK